MPDQQPCWRCGRLPAKRPQQQPAIPPMATPMSLPLIIVRPAEKPFIPRWLACTGTLGIFLFIALMATGAYLFLTADRGSEEEANPAPVAIASETLSSSGGSIITPATPGTLPPPGVVSGNLPTVSVPTHDPNALPTAAVAVGPFAETSIAMQPTATPTSAASLLPTPSLAPTVTPITPTPFVCPGAPPSRLEVNRQADVISPNTVRVRDNPGVIGTNVILNIVRGERVTIVDGPVCLDTLVWWRVQLATGLIGWMAEGDQSNYFLELR